MGAFNFLWRYFITKILCGILRLGTFAVLDRNDILSSAEPLKILDQCFGGLDAGFRPSYKKKLGNNIHVTDVEPKF